MNLRKYLSSMRDYDSDDMLGLMGLQKRSNADWVFPMLAGLGAGVAIGAGLALFLTPYKGEEVREKVRKGASDAQRMLNERVGMIGEKMGIGGGAEASTGNVATSRTVGVGSGVGSSGMSGGTGSVGGGNRGY